MPEHFHSHEEWVHHNPVGNWLLYTLPARIGRKLRSLSPKRRDPSGLTNGSHDGSAGVVPSRAVCDHEWTMYEGPSRVYTGWLERCEKCGDILQVIQ